MLFVLLIVIGKTAKAQEYIYISEDGLYRFLRVNAAITSMSMRFKDSTGYTAYGIHLSNEVKIISAAWDVDNKWTVHDGFYLDLSFGRGPEHADKTVARTYSNTRSRGAFTTNFGYYGMFGYRTQPWGVLGGIDFRVHQASVAKFTMPDLNGPLMYFCTPLMLRLEKGLDKENPNQRIALTLSSTLSSKKRAPIQNMQLEYGLSDNGRWNLFAQWIHQKANAEDVYKFTGVHTAVFNQLTVGLRVGNLP